VADLISRTGRTLSEKGIAFYFVVVPDKAVVYSDCLPDWAQKSPAPTVKQKILSMLSEDATVRGIDLAPAMIQARRNCPQSLYYRIDSPWNAVGASQGYRGIVSRLNEDQFNLKMCPEFTYTETMITTGDLAGLIGEFKLREDIKYHPQIDNPIQETIVEHDPVHGGPKLIRTENPSGALRLFMIRDSFATDMIPYFAASFRSCRFYWTKNIDESMAQIEKELPDIVILETIERYLYQLYEENFEGGLRDNSDF
jgi:hypothetical protein